MILLGDCLLKIQFHEQRLVWLINRFNKKIKMRLFDSQLAKNTGWMLVGIGIRSIFQFIAFLLLARTLGPEKFGNYAGVLALATLLSPFVELGGYNLVIRDITAGVPRNIAIGNAFFLTSLAFPVGISMFVILSIIMFPRLDLEFSLCIGVAELFFGRILAVTGGLRVVQGNLWQTAVIEVFGGLCRLLFVLILQRSQGMLIFWGWLHIFQTFIMATIALAWTVLSGIWPTYRVNQAFANLKDGFHFATALSAQSAYTDLDKTMLVRLSSPTDAGVYSAAYRFISVAYLPLSAFLGALYPKFFLEGQTKGYSGARKLANRTLIYTAAYGVILSISIWLFSQSIVSLLGDKYSDSIAALRWLAVVALLQSLYYPLGDALTGSGRQQYRAGGQIIAFLANLILNIILIPKFGWLGSTWATILTQTMILIAYLLPKYSR
jgi:O-antigen/teichoic acid export membrane protein